MEAQLDIFDPAARVTDPDTDGMIWGRTSVRPGAAPTARAMPRTCMRGPKMTQRTCSVDGCERKSRARGWCSMHYKRWLARGTVQERTVLDRLLAKVDVQDDGCWRWRGTTTHDGYGQIYLHGATPYVHRVAYEQFVGPIPAGMQLDHLCHNLESGCPGGPGCEHRRCCNPAHLEPVTGSENTRRTPGYQKNACVHGHALTPENTFTTREGWRRCRVCIRAQWAKK